MLQQMQNRSVIGDMEREDLLEDDDNAAQVADETSLEDDKTLLRRSQILEVVGIN